MNNNILEVLSEVFSNKESRFASFKYRNQKNELSLYLVHLNVNLRKVYTNDIKTLQRFVPKTELEKECKDEIISSLQESLDTNFNNSNYTKQDYYTTIANNVKTHENNLYINCFVVSKTIIEEGVYKEVKSREKTIVKNKLRKLLKSNKFREFKLDINSLETVKLNGKTIEIS